jgi:hypothetical protein
MFAFSQQFKIQRKILGLFRKKRLKILNDMFYTSVLEVLLRLHTSEPLSLSKKHHNRCTLVNGYSRDGGGGGGFTLPIAQCPCTVYKQPTRVQRDVARGKKSEKFLLHFLFKFHFNLAVLL